ncbi:MAG: ring-cleaving dioxygenase, partial [Bacillota bacterium]
MSAKTAGIHHITALAGDPQATVDFYAGVLGLRLVKVTVNFDAPDIYHFYFGDETGKPGTAMTFFPYQGAPRGRVGGGQVGVTTFVVPAGTLDFWEARLKKFGIPVERTERFGETFLRFADHDGLHLELVAREEGPESTWSFGGVPTDKAIKGFGGAVLYSLAPEQTLHVLENLLGLERVGASEDGQYVRLRGQADLGQIIDIRREPVPAGSGGAGTVHHIAWRAGSLPEQEGWRQRVSSAGFDVTPIVDRKYFTSIYFRERGGILFEIATDGPGFTVDEPVEALGQKLMLPAWLEPYREHIAANLQPFEVRVLDSTSPARRAGRGACPQAR